MPSIDPSKDYYAALETSPACSESDIKKQYHKLARLYHPDRNPGKEAEYSPRFQRIQEAYEILNDPEQRTKYDIKRKSRGQTFFRPTPAAGSAQRASAYQATSDFPPPPRRTGFQRTHTEVPPTARTNGTRQYTSWTPPVPPSRERTSAAKEAQERAAKFSAWEAMNRSRGSAPVGQQPPPQRKYNVPPPFQAQQRPVPTPPQAADLRAEFNRQRAKSGDMPPRSADDDSRGPNLFRAASTRTTKKQGFDPYSSDVGGYESPVKGPSAYRTTSGRADSPYPYPPLQPTSQPESQRPDPMSQSRSRSGDDVPFAEGTPKEKMPYPSNSGEKTYFDLRRTASLVDATKLSANDARTAPPERRRSEQSETGFVPRPKATFSTSPTHSEESIASSEGSSADATTPVNGHRRSHASESDGPLKSSLRSGPKQTEKPGVRFDRFAQFQEPMYHSSNPEMRSPSQDGAEVSPTGKTRPMASESASPPTRSSSFPNMTRLAGEQKPSTAQEEDGDRASNSAGVESSVSPGAKAFRAEEWERQQWTFDSAVNAQSPNKARLEPRSRASASEIRSSVKPRTPLRPGTPVPTTLEEEEAAIPLADGLDEGEPMDIDTEPIAHNRKPSVVISDTDRPEQEPRAVYVETSNPQWRSREGGSFNSQDRRPSLPNLGSFSIQPQAGQSPPSSRSRPPPPNTQPSKSHIDFSGWRHVTPFGPSGATNGQKGAALDNMKGDLGTTLPFPSQASASHPFASQFRPSSQEIASPPKPPPIPAAMGREYCSKLFVYISAYHTWYSQMTARLQEIASQQVQFTTNLQSPTSPASPRPSIHPQWIDLYGETPTQRGWDSYLRVQQEEARLRTTLNVAADRHRQTLEAHHHLREKNRGVVAASYHRPGLSR